MQDEILQNGLNSYQQILLWHIPLFLTFLFSIFDYIFVIALKSIISNLISILPSLIGFLIASLTILISMDNKMLNKQVKGVDSKDKISYRQVGASIFMYTTKIALVLIILSFIMPMQIPELLISMKVIILFLTKLFIFLLFSKLLVMIFYGLLFLSSAIAPVKIK